MTRPTEARRREVCEELGLSYPIVLASGPALVKLDRLIELRDAMPPHEAENLAAIAQAWKQKMWRVQ
jgi:hypothetical protein